MSAKHDLTHSILITIKNNKDGSYSTRAARKNRMLMMAEQIIEGGYKIAHIKQLQFKHVEYLVERWLKEGLSAGTIKNRMTDLRWVMGKYGKACLMPGKNEAFNIPKRRYTTNKDKSVLLPDGDLSQILDSDVRMSLLLQRAFGLRREESIKICLNEAVIGDELHLKGVWCKNGRPRVVKIYYPEQWEVIRQIKEYLGDSKRALIPAHRSYVQQQHVYDRQTSRAGLHKLHGLRHAYAQKRYFDLTGRECPARGGMLSGALTAEQKNIDLLARERITLDLGHSRLSILSVYLGQ